MFLEFDYDVFIDDNNDDRVESQNNNFESQIDIFVPEVYEVRTFTYLFKYHIKYTIVWRNQSVLILRLKTHLGGE